MRIETNLPNASNLIGTVYFAKVADGAREDHQAAFEAHKKLEPDDKKSNEWRWWNNEREQLRAACESPPPWMLSAEIEEPQAAKLLGIPGFRVANRTPEEIANVDELLHSVRQGTAGITATEKDQTIVELQNANLLVTAERDEWRTRAQKAERSLEQTKLSPSERVKEVEAEKAKLEATVAELREKNEHIAKALNALQATPITVAAAPKAAPVKRRKRRKRRRVVAAKAQEPTAPSVAAAAQPG